MKEVLDGRNAQITKIDGNDYQNGFSSVETGYEGRVFDVV